MCMFQKKCVADLDRITQIYFKFATYSLQKQNVYFLKKEMNEHTNERTK